VNEQAQSKLEKQAYHKEENVPPPFGTPHNTNQIKTNQTDNGGPRNIQFRTGNTPQAEQSNSTLEAYSLEQMK
jgi:hypothetical protein